MSKLTEVEKLEEENFMSDDNNEVPPSDIIAFNELRSCADLFRMHTEETLNIQPEFQREVVWPSPAQTRFIDSLIKNLPIPSMCFSFDYKTEQWQVIDGLQRMSSIIRFLSGDPSWTLASTEDLVPEIRGINAAKFLEKDSKLNKYYKRVQNISIPVTVLRCDLSKESHSEYLFTIFHRLNSGGMKLNSQEIRNCIFSGPFNDLLHELNKSSKWQKINKMQHTKGYRFRKEELILRFFAFHEDLESYTGHLSSYLNNYMKANRNLSDEEISEKKELFEKTIDLVWIDIFNGAAPARMNVTTLEGLLIGVSRNYKTLKGEPKSSLKARFKKFEALPDFSEESLTEGLSKKPRVIERLKAAIKTFS